MGVCVLATGLTYPPSQDRSAQFHVPTLPHFLCIGRRHLAGLIYFGENLVFVRPFSWRGNTRQSDHLHSSGLSSSLDKAWLMR